MKKATIDCTLTQFILAAKLKGKLHTETLIVETVKDLRPAVWEFTF